MYDEQTILQQLADCPEIFQQAEQVTGTEFQKQAALRELFPPELVRAALILCDLRKRAAVKFSRASEMWFDKTGLEQATAERIAQHKAQRFGKADSPVYDLCCGIGSDSIALALSGNDVVSVDQSPLACLRTRLNAQVYGIADRIQTRQTDVTSLETFDSLVHIDPDRRAGRSRAIRLEDYAPPLEFLQELKQHSPGGAIKLSPASNFGGKFHGCEIELISLDGECKEATVWFGAFAGNTAMRATVLPDGFSIAGNPWEFRPQVGPPGKYVYDPDPAVVRAGLVDQLVEELGIRRLDAAEEYLTSDDLIESPALAAFELLENLPNNDREIRKAVRKGAFGEIEIKSRHVPTNAEGMRKKMSLSGSGRASLLIARVDGKTRALLCRRIM